MEASGTGMGAMWTCAWACMLQHVRVNVFQHVPIPLAEAWVNRLSVAIRMFMKQFRDVLQNPNVRRVLQVQAAVMVHARPMHGPWFI